MRNIKSQSRLSLLLALACCILAFGLPATSANKNQDPVVTSKQIAALPSRAATSTDRIALYQALLDMQNPWTVMCVAAHPDDEDGTSLIVMRHKYGAHTVSLFSTFGEGGQNAIGPELYEELGAIRAHETMAAAEIQGSEPHFLGLKDFGFSKTRDEAFRFWGHEEALRRMVLQIRKLRPDVIITNHSTTSNDHGQHQATALMVVEAFDAAADPNKFPEQLNDGVTTWQVQRLFVRMRGNNPPAADAKIVTINPNESDPIRGETFAEEALHALQQHATQGPWPKTIEEMAMRLPPNLRAPGNRPQIRYTLVREATGAAPMPAAQSQNFLDGLQLPADLARHVAAPTIDGKPLTDFINDRVLLTQKLHEYEARLLSTQMLPFRVLRPLEATREALAAAAGVTVRLSLSEPVVVPGVNASAKLEISNQGSTEIKVGPISSWLSDFNRDNKVLGKVAYSTGAVAAGETKAFPISQTVPSTATITVPSSTHLYDNAWRGFSVGTVVNVYPTGSGFSLIREVSTDVVPAIEITSVNQSPLVITPQTAGRAQALSVGVVNHGKATANTSLEVVAAADNSEQTKAIAEATVQIPSGKSRNILVNLPQPEKRIALQRGPTIRIDLKTGVRETIAEPPTPPTKLQLLVRTRDKSSNQLTIPVIYADARVANDLRVGYIRGFDFSLPNALIALGVESKELSVDDVKAGDLSQFTSVIVDNRVYESKPELIAVNQKLLDYAQAGGNLIVFYHKSDEWNPDERRNRPQLAPYKLILGGERVTDENAPITFLEPDHPLLNVPNKMGQNDFKDWIQERGLYYPKEWDPQFHALLQSSDPGEQPLKGGLLVADYGKGHYIYTSMVWYRELRGGIPGAYRMLANMISYGRTEGIG